jgi:flavin reductase (DIM6/NTAB) family NADH-FMN oxidoreductase RutF
MPRTLHTADLPVPARYKLLTGAIVPRPIAFVSTVSTDGHHNLAPYSFFNGLGSNPMTLLFCPANNADGSEKDTLRNCKSKDEGGTGEFVVNIATTHYANKVSAAAEELPHDESEFTLTGLTPEPADTVAPPRLAESPIAFECRTLQVVRTNPGQPAGGNLVIGEVLATHIQDDHLVNDRFHIDPARLAAIGRMAGLAYCHTDNRFDIPRGRAALDAASER